MTNRFLQTVFFECTTSSTMHDLTVVYLFLPFQVCIGATIRSSSSVSWPSTSRRSHPLPYVAEIVNARWKTTHLTFFSSASAPTLLSFHALAWWSCHCRNPYMDYPWLLSWFLGVSSSTPLLEVFKLLSWQSYIHTVIIYAVLITMIFLVYVKFYSSDQIYSSSTLQPLTLMRECENIYSIPSY
jgi:hypothetical protein